jgi:hypothetical protein
MILVQLVAPPNDEGKQCLSKNLSGLESNTVDRMLITQGITPLRSTSYFKPTVSKIHLRRMTKTLQEKTNK